MHFIPRSALCATARLLLLIACAGPLVYGQLSPELLELDERTFELSEAGKYAEAITLAETALKKALAAPGNLRYDDNPRHDPAVAYFEDVLGRLHRYNNDLRAAESWMTRAVTDQAAIYGALSPEALPSTTMLGRIYAEQGRFDEAEKVLTSVRNARAAQGGENHRKVADAEVFLGQLYLEWDKPEKAKPHYLHALEIFSTDPSQTGNVAVVHSDLGKVYRETGDLQKAEQSFEKALQLFKSVGAHDAIAPTLDNLGTLRQDQRRFEDAEKAFRGALALRTAALGENDPEVGESLNNLGNLYFRLGDVAKARPLLERALGLKEKALGPEHPQVAMILSNLAVVEHHEGHLTESEALYKRACAIEEKALGAASSTCLGNLGMVQAALERPEAEATLRRAMSIDEKRFGHESIEVAQDAVNLAAILEETGKAAEAERLLKGALSTLERLTGPTSADLTPALNALGNFHVHQSKYAEAEPLFVRALKINVETLGEYHPQTGIAATNLANVYDMSGQADRALPLYRRTVENLRHQLENNFSYMAEDDRLAFVAMTGNEFHKFFSFCLDHAPRHAELAGEMFDLVLWRKGMIAASIASLRARIAASGDAKSLQLLERLQRKKTELARLVASGHASSRETAKPLNDEVRRIERELVQTSPIAAGEKRIHASTWKDIRNALERGEAAVEFVAFYYTTPKEVSRGGYYVGLVVRPNLPAPVLVRLGWAADLHGPPIVSYRKKARLERDPTLADKPDFHTAFWAPLLPALGDAKRVYVAADGVLNEVAWNVAPGARERLAAEYDLRLVVSTRDLVRPVTRRTDRTAVVIADPAFGSQSEEESALPQLPETREEAVAIADQLIAAGWKVESRLGPDATEEALKAMKHPRILHIATHGFLEDDAGEENQPRTATDAMFRSGLYFSGALDALRGVPAAQREDGILTAYEASTLDLHQTELVVLSGCDTGQGDIRAGMRAGEGIFGLRRALQEAGAESILMSMWEVRDDTTRKLMTEFYARLLSGQDKHDAFRGAQAAVARELEQQWGRDLPEQWGAFVLMGR